MIGACNRCGCSLEECECPDRIERPTQPIEAMQVEPGFLQALSMFLSFLKTYPSLSPPCFDCLGHHHLYMVRKEVWERAWPEHKSQKGIMLELSEARGVDVKRGTSQFLCFTCLEHRLGRSLEITDFEPEAAVNSSIRFGYRMGARTRS